MYALALALMVVIQPRRINQRHLAFTMLGNDFFSRGLDLIGQFGQRGAGLGQRDNIGSGKGHAIPNALYSVHYRAIQPPSAHALERSTARDQRASSSARRSAPMAGSKRRSLAHSAAISSWFSQKPTASPAR